MIKFVNGDFFDFEADIRVNTVNCVGIMGAGVALAFKEKYPDMFKQYAKDCKQGLIRPGIPSVWKSDDMFYKEIEIINFPTKDHWRKPSKYEYVENGLKWLSDYLKLKRASIITLPALGCGHGGLDWIKVKELIEKYLSDSQHNILVFEPNSSLHAGKSGPNDTENRQLLAKQNIKTISSKSSGYPDRLALFTEKDLYFYDTDNAHVENYSISIISSSKPSSVEIELVKKTIDYCEENHLSILFGSSVFDKKMAFEAIKKGLKVGIFLPTNIYKSALKANSSRNIFNLTLLSIGDPFESFDRKAYMPSVLSRLFLADRVVFTTNRLDWISKQIAYISKSYSKFYYFHTLSENDVLAIKQISAVKIEFTYGDIELN